MALSSLEPGDIGIVRPSDSIVHSVIGNAPAQNKGARFIFPIVPGIAVFTHLLASEGLLEVSSQLMAADVRPIVYVLSGFMLLVWALSQAFMDQSRAS